MRAHRKTFLCNHGFLPVLKVQFLAGKQLPFKFEIKIFFFQMPFFRSTCAIFIGTERGQFTTRSVPWTFFGCRAFPNQPPREKRCWDAAVLAFVLCQERDAIKDDYGINVR
jgi:hypothetical protein